MDANFRTKYIYCICRNNKERSITCGTTIPEQHPLIEEGMPLLGSLLFRLFEGKENGTLVIIADLDETTADEFQ